MKIKKIRAKSFSEALAIVKRELGPDAVILSSDDKSAGKSFVEVTAAVDYDMMTDDSVNYAQAIPKTSTNSVSDLVELKDEIRGLKLSIDSMRNSGFEFKLSGESRDIYFFLKERSIKDDFAYKLVERAQVLDDLPVLIAEDMNISRTDNNSSSLTNNSNSPLQRIAMLIGPSGVGKTTTLAKLASIAIREGKKVGMISMDTFKIGATEQIRIYSRMMGIPLSIVSSIDSLKKSVERFADKNLILIDTAGQNPNDEEYINNLKEIYASGLPIETQLLLSASSDCNFLMDTHKHYRHLPITHIAFTKTDEAVNFGSIYNLTRLYQKPVVYITTGQRVPGNLEFVDSKKLTNLILKAGSA
ncbi:MAG: flagellar biosynthesis protein FlhF [Nitrospira sp.]|nr:flagellar biosynthesis protein FlhF [Nitrospira sp.]